MAIDKEDIDIDEVDDDLDFDFDEFDDVLGSDSFDGGNGSKKDRKPQEVLKDGLKSGFSERVNVDDVSAEVKKVLPTRFVRTSEELGSYVREGKSLFDESSEELMRSASTLRVELGKTIKLHDKLIPNFLKDKLKFFTEYEKEKEDNYRGPSEEQRHQEMVQGELAAIQEAQVELQKASEARAMLRDQMESKRFESQQDLLYAIRSGVERTNSYQEQIASQYLSRSVEIGYHQLFTQRNIQKVITQSAEYQKAALDSIVKNTALPDIVKAHKSEVLREIGLRRVLGAATTKMGDYISGFKDKIVDNLKKSVKGVVQGVTGSAEMGGSALEMMNSATEMQLSFEGEKSASEIAGHKLGQFLAGQLSYFGGKKLIEKLDGSGKLSAQMERVTRIGEYAPEMLSRWADERSDNPIISFIKSIIPHDKQGDISHVMASRTKLNDKAEFDVATRKSIVDIIPTLLSKIHLSTEGIRKKVAPKQRLNDNNLLEWDHDKGVLTTRGELDDKLRQDITNSSGGETQKTNVYKLMNVIDPDGLISGEVRNKLAKEFLLGLGSPKGFDPMDYIDPNYQWKVTFTDGEKQLIEKVLTDTFKLQQADAMRSNDLALQQRITASQRYYRSLNDSRGRSADLLHARSLTSDTEAARHARLGVSTLEGGEYTTNMKAIYSDKHYDKYLTESLETQREKYSVSVGGSDIPKETWVFRQMPGYEEDPNGITEGTILNPRPRTFLYDNENNKVKERITYEEWCQYQDIYYYKDLHKPLMRELFRHIGVFGNKAKGVGQRMAKSGLGEERYSRAASAVNSVNETVVNAAAKVSEAIFENELAKSVKKATSKVGKVGSHAISYYERRAAIKMYTIWDEHFTTMLDVDVKYRNDYVGIKVRQLKAKGFDDEAIITWAKATLHAILEGKPQTEAEKEGEKILKDIADFAEEKAKTAAAYGIEMAERGYETAKDIGNKLKTEEGREELKEQAVEKTTEIKENVQKQVKRAPRKLKRAERKSRKQLAKEVMKAKAKLKEVATPIIDDVKEVAQPYVDEIQEAISPVTAVVGDKVKSYTEEAKEILAPKINQVRTNIQPQLIQLGETSQTVIDAVKEQATALQQKAKGKIEEVKEDITNAIPTKEEIKEKKEDVVNKVTQKVTETYQKAKRKASEIKTEIEEKVDELPKSTDELREGVKGFVDNLPENVRDIKAKLTEDVPDKINSVKETLAETKDKVNDVVKSRIQPHLDATRDVGEKIINRIKTNSEKYKRKRPVTINAVRPMTTQEYLDERVGKRNTINPNRATPHPVKTKSTQSDITQPDTGTISDVPEDKSEKVLDTIGQLTASIMDLKDEAKHKFNDTIHRFQDPEDKEEYFDIYVRGEPEPRLLASKLRAGLYTLAYGGEVVRTINDITGPVMEGNEFVITTEDFNKGLVNYRQEEINTNVDKDGLIARMNKYLNGGTMGITKKIYSTAFMMAVAPFKTTGTTDVYIRYNNGKSRPYIVMTRWKMMAHRYCNEDGSIIKSVKDIKGTVYDRISGDVVVTAEELPNCVDKEGRPLSKSYFIRRMRAAKDMLKFMAKPLGWTTNKLFGNEIRKMKEALSFKKKKKDERNVEEEVPNTEQPVEQDEAKGSSKVDKLKKVGRFTKGYLSRRSRLAGKLLKNTIGSKGLVGMVGKGIGKLRGVSKEDSADTFNDLSDELRGGEQEESIVSSVKRKLKQKEKEKKEAKRQEEADKKRVIKDEPVRKGRAEDEDKAQDEAFKKRQEEADKKHQEEFEARKKKKDEDSPLGKYLPLIFGALGAIGSIFKLGLSGLGRMVVGGVKDALWGVTKWAVKGISNAFGGVLKGAWNAMKGGVKGMLEAGKSVISNTKVGTMAKQGIDAVAGLGQRAVSAGKGLLSTAGGKVSNVLAKVGGNAAVKTVANAAAKIGGKQVIKYAGTAAAKLAGKATLAFLGPIGGAIALAWTLYDIGGFVWKLFSSPNTVDEFRIAAYGVNPESEYRSDVILKLEKLYLDKIKVDANGALVMPPLEINEKFAEIVGAFMGGKEGVLEYQSLSDEEKERWKQECWEPWYTERFQPVIYQHAMSLFQIDPKIKLNEAFGMMGDLKDGLVCPWLRHAYFEPNDPECPYGIVADPFFKVPDPDDEPEVGVADGNMVKTYYDKVVSKYTSDEKALREKDEKKRQAAEKSGEKYKSDFEFEQKTERYSRENSTVSGNYRTAIQDHTKAYVINNDGTKADTRLIGNTVYLTSDASKVKLDGRSIIDDGIAIRMRLYGLNSLVETRVRDLLRLEKYLLPFVTYSSEGATLTKDASIERVVAEFGASFGWSTSSEDISLFKTWLEMRFLPVYLSFCSAVNKTTGSSAIFDEANNMDGLDLYNIYLDLVKLRIKRDNDSLSIWEIPFGPIRGINVNRDSGTVTDNLTNLSQNTKMNILTEKDPRGNDPNKDKEQPEDSQDKRSKGEKIVDMILNKAKTMDEGIKSAETANTGTTSGGSIPTYGPGNNSIGAPPNVTGNVSIGKVPANRKAVAQALIDGMKKRGYSDVEQNLLLANATVESNNLKWLAELGSQQYIASKNYNGGPRYKGRGVIQTTHKYNYERLAKVTGRPEIVNNPELVETDPVLAAESALVWWDDAKKSKSFARAVAAGDIDAVSRGVGFGPGNAYNLNKNVEKSGFHIDKRRAAFKQYQSGKGPIREILGESGQDVSAGTTADTTPQTTTQDTSQGFGGGQTSGSGAGGSWGQPEASTAQPSSGVPMDTTATNTADTSAGTNTTTNTGTGSPYIRSESEYQKFIYGDGLNKPEDSNIGSSSWGGSNRPFLETSWTNEAKTPGMLSTTYSSPGLGVDKQTRDNGYNPLEQASNNGTYSNRTADVSNIDPRALKAAEWADKNAYDKYIKGKCGFCARGVANALEKGGFKFTRNASAWQYAKHGTLEKMGFKLVGKGCMHKAVKGDVMVWDAHQVRTAPRSGGRMHGHIQIFTGQYWVSDFKQRRDGSPIPGTLYTKSPIPGYMQNNVWHYRCLKDGSQPQSGGEVGMETANTADTSIGKSNEGNTPTNNYAPPMDTSTRVGEEMGQVCMTNPVNNSLGGLVAHEYNNGSSGSILEPPSSSNTMSGTSGGNSAIPEPTAGRVPDAASAVASTTSRFFDKQANLVETQQKRLFDEQKQMSDKMANLLSEQLTVQKTMSNDIAKLLDYITNGGTIGNSNVHDPNKPAPFITPTAKSPNRQLTTPPPMVNLGVGGNPLK